MTEREPVVILSSGVRVLQGVWEWCQTLRDAGHTIAIVDGDVFVTPPCDSDLAAALDNAAHDVACVLADWARPRVH